MYWQQLAHIVFRNELVSTLACCCDCMRVPSQLVPQPHQGQQREQKRKLMGVTDRAMYSMGNLVFQGPAARLLAFCYLTVMHLLVFFSLTHMTHRTGGAMMDHHEALLSTHRHDLTSMMHADGEAVAAAASSSPQAAAMAGQAVHGLLRRLMVAVLPPNS